MKSITFNLRFHVFAFLLLFSSFEAVSQEAWLETTGDVLLITLPATALGSSLILHDKPGTLQIAKGFILNQILTFGLKEIIDKPRPKGMRGNAFPSGHTSTTFQSAAFIQKRYGWKYGIPAYLLASFTGYSRINADKHDGWDVLAGAIVGISSAYLFTSEYKDPRWEAGIATTHDLYSFYLKIEF